MYQTQKKDRNQILELHGNLGSNRTIENQISLLKKLTIGRPQPAEKTPGVSPLHPRKRHHRHHRIALRSREIFILTIALLVRPSVIGIEENDFKALTTITTVGILPL